MLLLMLIASAVAAAFLGVAAARRHWALHTIIAATCTFVLVTVAVYVATGGLIADLPAWFTLLGFAVDVLLLATAFDINRASKHDGAAR